jgi:ribosome-associated toxin RatA of RatAB toxin-antitoxin module
MRHPAARGAGLKVVERSAIVPYTAAQMFALVNDVARYPEFLPWCAGGRSEVVADNEVLASVRIVWGLLRTDFTTRNTLQPDAAILMNLVDGPFRSLTGQWHFTAIADRGSKVSFRLEFAFKNALTAAALNAAFEALCGTIVDAFAQRARKIYG